MKKLLLIVLCLTGFYVNAQEIPEPEFVGECVYVKSDNTSVLLEKHLTQNRTVASTGLMMTGIGKVRTQLQIPGCCSNLSINKNSEIKLIIKSTENSTDPFSIIKVFKFEKKKKYRRAEVSSLSNFGTTKSNNYINVSFVGKKYGESSYAIKLDAIEPGEYGIMILNPNALDQKQTVISTFSITE
ncbi:hypothetical protein [Myroides marinus]|uniref:hypothetical protein n=1 Tax=Myroides marinus TaxID=703342 RepID=UPI002574E75D|nr:hypothetical protein [Myroides marinus]MDM1353571.1 hypothetical protein [Myroides marinus]MDM1367086.1 hypothetical protein [Myroides marinus]MDM1377995.1 hypothetical protein [Myroides marinus]MDM1385266.1 hypothetical protein [Myroides marinus]MDM1392479.1 hypothetical protein [Myroides marinus]